MKYERKSDSSTTQANIVSLMILTSLPFIPLQSLSHRPIISFSHCRVQLSSTTMYTMKVGFAHTLFLTTAILLVLFLVPCASWTTTTITSHNTRQRHSSTLIQQLYHPTGQRSLGVVIQNKNSLHQDCRRSKTICRSQAADASSLSQMPPDEDNYQTIGEGLIRQAGTACGANDFKIEWSSGLIKVVVLGDAFVSNPTLGDVDDDSDNGSVLMEMEEDIDEDNDSYIDDTDEDDETLDSLIVTNDIDDDGDGDVDEDIVDVPSKGVDVVELARAINAAFAEDSTGLWIAETHEIEVTTPGAPDELTGIMWKVYKGFPVICRHQDPKTKQQKTIEGRLHDRTDEFTVINIKGRMKKLKNMDVLSVKLPKAKKEKGG